MTYSKRRSVVAALVPLAMTGCVPEDLPSDGTKPVAAVRSGKPLTGPGQAFQTPAPTKSEHDPRLVTLAATNARIEATLATARSRLKEIKTALDGKALTETDLRTVTELLKPLTAKARGDCDAILRAAQDLKTELGFSGSGYEAAARLYRERAKLHTEPALAAITVRMAEEFERLAYDVPRRTRVAEELVARLLEMQTFLAATDRCLWDVGAAMTVLSAGSNPVTVSEEGRAFREQLERFIAVLEEYQRKLFGRHAPPEERLIRHKPAKVTRDEQAPTPPQPTQYVSYRMPAEERQESPATRPLTEVGDVGGVAPPVSVQPPPAMMSVAYDVVIHPPTRPTPSFPAAIAPFPGVIYEPHPAVAGHCVAPRPVCSPHLLPAPPGRGACGCPPGAVRPPAARARIVVGPLRARAAAHLQRR